MVTNPQIPPRKRDDHAHMDLLKGGRGRGWSPVVIIVVAAAILLALIVWLPRAPKNAHTAPSSAAVPPQATGQQVQLSDLQITPSTPSGAARLTGTVFNSGNTDITAIVGQATFMGANGQVAGQVTAPFLSLTQGGTTQPFLNDPIKPGERRAFEMQVNQVPQGWNHSMPALALTQVAAAGNAGGQGGNTPSSQSR